VTRSQDEARALAAQVLERAKKGEDFDELVRTYTDDRAPGIYSMSNTGVAPASGEFPRERMVPAFGNVGFSLAPGEVGMAQFDPRTSPYGWHIIKRLE
jgi:parvulin-like peptidyl-prolyl isomerase